MDSAQFKTMRETLGFTSQDVADAMAVNERTARRWEITVAPPDDAVEWVKTEWRKTLLQVRESLDYLDEMGEQYGESGSVRLTRYVSNGHASRAGIGIPVRRHSAIIGLIAFALSLDGRDFEIVYRD